MSRPKYSVEEKIKAAERYLRGEASIAEIAAEKSMGKGGERQIEKLNQHVTKCLGDSIRNKVKEG